MRKRGRKAKLDADLDGEIDHYEPSDSDDGFDDEERDILNNAVGRRRNEEEREVLKVYSSSEDSDDEEGDDEEDEEVGSEHEGDEEKALYGGGVESDMDSDIEDKPKDDGLPDSKSWGSDKRQFYDTDYVDKDYLGFDDEEAAIEEEKEADNIQKRLLAHLEGTDFSLGLLEEVEDKKKEAARKREEPEEFEEEERVEVDLSSLTHEEAIKLLKRESPEMFPLLKHCKSQLEYLKEKVWPILNMADQGLLKKSRKAVDLMEIVNKLTLHYTMNVLFYLYSKENGESTNNHPVLKRFNVFKSLLQELDVLIEQLNPEINMILEAKENNEELVFIEKVEQPLNNRKEKRKRKLELLEKIKQAKKINKAKKKRIEELQSDNYVHDLKKQVKMEETKVQYEEEEEEEDDDEDDNEEQLEGEKRGVTFSILKNRGLTPKRKKENRNPRVKNRNKYKKAIKRRRGQVREPRKELNRYGGEISGIKRNISKSIKLK